MTFPPASRASWGRGWSHHTAADHGPRSRQGGQRQGLERCRRQQSWWLAERTEPGREVRRQLVGLTFGHGDEGGQTAIAVHADGAEFDAVCHQSHTAKPAFQTGNVRVDGNPGTCCDRTPRPHRNNAPLELVTEGYGRPGRVLTADEVTVGTAYPGRADPDDHLAVRAAGTGSVLPGTLTEPRCWSLRARTSLPGTSPYSTVQWPTKLAEAARAVRRSSSRVPSRSADLQSLSAGHHSTSRRSGQSAAKNRLRRPRKPAEFTRCPQPLLRRAVNHRGAERDAWREQSRRPISWLAVNLRAQAAQKAVRRSRRISSGNVVQLALDDVAA